MKKTILMIIGLILMINGFLLIFFINFNFGVVIVFGIGLFLMILSKFYEKLMNIKWFRYSLYLISSFLIIMISFIFIYGNFYTADYKEDAAIILGAGINGYEVSETLKARLDKGVEFHEKNPQALLVLSGGQGPQELTSEANAMEKYLIENGVNKEKIIKEQNATSTYENLIYSKEILDNNLIGEYKVVIITNDFHLYRAKALSKKVELNANVIGSPIVWYTYPLTYLREVTAIIKMWLFQM